MVPHLSQLGDFRTSNELVDVEVLVVVPVVVVVVVAVVVVVVVAVVVVVVAVIVVRICWWGVILILPKEQAGDVSSALYVYACYEA